MNAERTHPLKAWRQLQSRWNAAKQRHVPLSVAQAAREFGVPFQTWNAWERWRGERGHRLPDWNNMRKLYVFTHRCVRPDHFHDLADLEGGDGLGVAA